MPCPTVLHDKAVTEVIPDGPPEKDYGFTPEVCPFDSLCCAIFTEQRESRLMAQLSMYSAYFDASGHPSDQPFVVVSGFVANIEQWQGFNFAWAQHHTNAGVNLPFHMTDFMARQRDDYKKWSRPDPEADKFLNKLSSVPLIYSLLSVSYIVEMGAYRQMDEVLMLEQFVPAYALAAHECVSAIEQWKKWVHVEHPIEYVFEDGDFGKGKFMDWMRVERAPAPIFRNKKDFAGLQSADQLAWEVAHFKKEKRKNPTFQPSPSFARLLAVPRLHFESDIGTLLEVCEKNGVPIKRGKLQIVVP